MGGDTRQTGGEPSLCGRRWVLRRGMVRRRRREALRPRRGSDDLTQHLMERAVLSLRTRARDRSPVVDRPGASDARVRGARPSGPPADERPAEVTAPLAVGAHFDQADQAALLGVVLQVRGGDFGARMPPHRTGVPGKIADAVDDVIAANQMLEGELSKVSRVVGKEGKLSRRVVLGGSGGGWSGNMVDQLNGSMASCRR